VAYIQQLIDSYINIILPSPISIILFYFIANIILLQMSERCNKITKTTVDSFCYFILFYFIANWRAAEAHRHY